MFDFAWSEVALIGVVALVLIGPKDMPVAIKAVSDVVRKMRRMAGEFQHHVDDMMKEANLSEMRDSINEIRSLNLREQVRRTIDPDRSLGRAFDDPFRDHKVNPHPPAAPAHYVPPPAGAGAASSAPPPAFIPPGTAAPAAPVPEVPPPAFIPPAAAEPGPPHPGTPEPGTLEPGRLQSGPAPDHHGDT